MLVLSCDFALILCDTNIGNRFIDQFIKATDRQPYFAFEWRNGAFKLLLLGIGPATTVFVVIFLLVI